MTRSYVLSDLAEADLYAITQNTAKQWGAAQCRAYTAALEIKAAEVAQRRGVFTNLSNFLPGLRMATSSKHHICCQIQ